MAISEFEIKRYEKELDKFIDEHRPPVHVRDQLDINYKIENQSVVLFEIRANFRNPSEKLDIPIAKATYVKTQKVWKIYWQKSDLKWHEYEPVAIVKYLEEFLNVVGQDEYDCFFS
ncbi:DUF3024 domain-containing protein [Psychromonas aquatilis]|uniref:DUF3024 domain-containing protein n=1 Tax=Psychromonas aquatilis TaxID=2005072 RepID=A0ABU9GU09_9GAMM